MKLGDYFVHARNGYSVQQSDDQGGLPVSRIETIALGEIDMSRVGFAGLAKQDAVEWLLSEGDILMSHINSPKHLGKCARYSCTFGPLIHGMNLLSLRPNPLMLDSRYAVHYFRSESFLSQVRRITNHSVNQSSFSVTNLKKQDFRPPALAEQRRIADILDRADALKRKRQQALKLADDLLRATFLDMFGDPESNPKRLQTARLGDLCFIGTGGTPSRAENENYGGTIPWVKTTEVNGTRILQTEETLTEQGLSSSNCKVFPADSILIAMYGQGKTRGQVGILGIPASTNQACAVVVPTTSISTDYLYQHLRLDYKRLRSLGRGGNQPNLNLSLVRDHEVLVPSSDQQTRFSSLVARISATIRDLEAATTDIGRLTTTLTDNLFASREVRN